MSDVVDGDEIAQEAAKRYLDDTEGEWGRECFIEGARWAIERDVAGARQRALPVQKPIDLKHVTCPQCGKPFRLSWDNDSFYTLRLRGCPSGGIYDVTIKCPHCDYEEAL